MMPKRKNPAVIFLTALAAFLDVGLDLPPPEMGEPEPAPRSRSVPSHNTAREQARRVRQAKRARDAQ
jgi:hypothetical protein